jgi:hypothetical protein
MNLFNRLVVTLLAAILTLGGAAVLAAISGWLRPADLALVPGSEWAVGQLRELPGMSLFWTALGALGGALVGLVLLTLELRPSRRDREIVLKRDKLGAVNVSLVGLRRLAEHVIGEIPGIQSVRSEARPTRQGVAFQCHVLVLPDANTAVLAEEIRTQVAAAVERHIGRPAAPIHVHAQVGTVVPAAKKRVS